MSKLAVEMSRRRKKNLRLGGAFAASSQELAFAQPVFPPKKVQIRGVLDESSLFDCCRSSLSGVPGSPGTKGQYEGHIEPTQGSDFGREVMT